MRMSTICDLALGLIMARSEPGGTILLKSSRTVSAEGQLL